MASRSIIITGASAAIGAACARRFHQAGDRVVLADSDEEAIRSLKDELGDERAAHVVADIGNRLHVHNIIAEALEAFGRVDVLINASMEVYSGAFLEMTEEAFDGVINANLRGCFLINQAVGRQFARQADASTDEPADAAIVNIMSVEAVVATAERSAFAASQGGMHQLTKAISLALSPYGVRVNGIAIGAVKGEFLKEIDLKSARSTVPMNRVGDPEEIAEVAFFLASKSASYITGQTIFVDGGRMVRSAASDYEEKKD